MRGHAVDRNTLEPVGNMPFVLTISLNGFERVYELYTDDNGEWRYAFTPEAGESGRYRVWATHPDIVDKPDQEEFTITRVTVSPRRINASLPFNYQKRGSVTVGTSAGLSLTNVHLVCEAADQPGGVFPQGVHVDVSRATVASLGPEQSAALTFTLWGDKTVVSNGELRVRIESDGAPEGAWGTSVVSYAFFEAAPVIDLSPSVLETGVAAGETVTHPLVLQNIGFATLENAVVRLAGADGGPAPDWMTLNGPTRGDLVSGDHWDLSITVAPTSGVAQGVYDAWLTVDADNHALRDVDIHVVVDASGRGGVIFKVEDIFQYQGLSNGYDSAALYLAKQDGLPFSTNGMTGAGGEILFQDLPVGRYTYRASAPRYQSKSGTVWIRPGIVQSETVFLKFNAVTYEWSVTPTVIGDQYDITLSAVYDTSVPAPVLTLSPASMQLPEMAAGDVFNAEFVLSNEGMIRAEALVVTVPAGDQFYRAEMMVDPPEYLAPGESVRMPIRVTCIRSPDTGEAGVCSIHTLTYSFTFEFVCANGEVLSDTCDGTLMERTGDCSDLDLSDGGFGNNWGSDEGWMMGGFSSLRRKALKIRQSFLEQFLSKFKE